MNANDEKIRTAIAEQAGEWFVAHDQGPLDANESAALTTWLQSSPAHIEEFLAVSAIARDLKEARTDPKYSLEAILARARAAEDTTVRPLWSRVIDSVRIESPRRWLPAAMTMASVAILTFGVFLAWNASRFPRPSASVDIVSLNFATRHGEQLTQRLADNSVLHLNTDSSVSVRYSKNERTVILRAGQANFEVAHEPSRAFRVLAGSAEISDLGTKFDVRLGQGTAVITVVEGRVAVRPASPSQNQQPGSIELGADQQLRVDATGWPAAPVWVDAERATAWLHRQIAFENEPLERVAAEYNRYTSRPFEIATPALRNLKISGVFATDDTEAFIAFLRSLKGVRVEVTEARVIVTAD